MFFKLSIFFILFTACNKGYHDLTQEDIYTPVTINSDWFVVN